jgi:two-component sensor histidine kinase
MQNIEFARFSAGRSDQEIIMAEPAVQQVQEQMLLHELNHRINNEFAAIISAVSLAAASSNNDEVKVALADVARLLHRYADVHRALQMPERDVIIDAAAYLGQLCLSISRSMLDDKKIRLLLSAQSIPIQADRCRRLGMIIYELITNAARHVFADGSGEIRVAIWRDGEFVKCSVRDSGSAAVNIQLGRGLKIVDALSKALGGRFKQTLGSQGSKALLVFPFPRDNEWAFDGPPSAMPRAS